MPLPMVAATAVPNTKAAMKFQNAAQRTARKGVSTRVDTTVAIELAASCQPFENSKASVRKTVIRTRANRLTGSGVLQDDALDYVGDVFAFIHGGFHDFEDLFPLDDLDGVLFFLEKLGDQRAADAVALVFEAVDFDDVLQSLVGGLHRVNGAGQFGGGSGEHLGEFDGTFPDAGYSIENETAGGGVDQIDYVVHGAAQFVHVFAVKRGDEGLVELAKDLVGDFVALVFDGFHALHLFRHAGVVFEHVGESVGAVNDICGLFAEEDEEISIPRHEPLQESGHVTGSPLRSTVRQRQVYRTCELGARKRG